MQKVAVLLDLDGVLATRDIAFDLFDAHGFGKFFSKASHEIADNVNSSRKFDGINAYAGQTIEYVMKKALAAGKRITESEIANIARGAKLMRGSKGLVAALKKNRAVGDIFIVSTTYKIAADAIGRRLGIPLENVFATNLRIEKGQVTGTSGPACGGVHKASIVRAISKKSGFPLEKMVVVGDSITDIGMMNLVVKSGGLGIAFNAHNDLLMRKPNVIYAGRSLKPVYGIVKAFALCGHEGVKRIVQRNIRMRRFVGVPMSLIGRPFLFSPGLKDVKAGRKSEKYRKKVRSKKIARLR